MKILTSVMAIASMGLAASGSATVLLSNLEEPEKAYNDISSTLWAAQGFWTDGRAYTLLDVRAPVGNETGPVAPFAELRKADEFGNMDTSPEGLVATFTTPSMEGARSIRVFTPNGLVKLAANTKYYFVLGNLEGDGTFEWSYALGNNSSGNGFFDQYEYTFDAGGSWSVFGTDDPFHMEVNVSSKSLESIPGIRIGG